MIKVLIVEDMEINRDILVSILEDEYAIEIVNGEPRRVPVKDKNKDKDVDQHMEWQRNVIRSEYVDEKKSIQTEKEIQSKGRGSVE